MLKKQNLTHPKAAKLATLTLNYCDNDQCLSTIWLWWISHSCLEKADVTVHTRRNHSQKPRRIGYNHIDPYGQSFFPNCISVWNGLAKDIAEANTYHCTNKTDGRSTLTLTGITGTTHTLYGRRLFMVSSIELHLHHKTAPS